MTKRSESLVVRSYGPPGRPVVVLHGGPGAPGGAERLARGLADRFHVLEPWQRRSSAEPLTVARHVEDLHEVIAEHAPGQRPAIVGESWGAMLGLAHAAEHPDDVSCLALVGCGTFDPKARARLRQTLAERTGPELRARLARLATDVPDESERFARMRDLTAPLYTCCAAADERAPDASALDPKGHHESWSDMVRLQESGVFPARFASIRCPVLMLHGAYDPHPGALIRDGLKDFLPQLEYVELDRCGHSPWVEEHARDAFFARLRAWLSEQELAGARA